MRGYKGPRGEEQNYRWANVEPGDEVEVELDLPPGCRQTDIDVKIRPDHVVVKIMGRTVIDDALLNRCDQDESRWEVRGTRLVVVLQKANGSTTPWPSVFVGDCKQTFDFGDVQRFF
mmetsp:Transcript_55997/g.112240  ORF Transcript_55997/g.112240 Transcript_55997/m.112240 type:complete len:117 (-) Transcript_55997:148-498(-)